jgi:TubC N-terminal docking domain
VTAADLVRNLRDRGVVLEVVGGLLKCRGRQSLLTERVLDQIRTYRQEIRALLQTGPVASPQNVPPIAEDPINASVPSLTKPDALYGGGLVVDVMREYRAHFGAPDGFLALLEQVSGCDALHGRVTDEHLLALRAHVARLRSDRRPT